MGLIQRSQMRPSLLWAACAVLGIATALITGLGGFLAALVALVLAVPLVLRGDRLAAFSGLLLGFGAMWLLLLAGRAASGGNNSDYRFWVTVGLGPLAIGIAAGLVRILRPRDLPRR